MLQALGNHALTKAINRTGAVGLVQLDDEQWVYGTGWRDFEWYYRQGGRADTEFEEARGKILFVLYGKNMYARAREPRGSLLSRLFELSGERDGSLAED